MILNVGDRTIYEVCINRISSFFNKSNLIQSRRVSKNFAHLLCRIFALSFLNKKQNPFYKMKCETSFRTFDAALCSSRRYSSIIYFMRDKTITKNSKHLTHKELLYSMYKYNNFPTKLLFHKFHETFFLCLPTCSKMVNSPRIFCYLHSI